MKIEFKESKQDFTPFEFTVKVETLEDARAWYATFNHAKNVALIGQSYCDILTDGLEVGANCSLYVEGISNEEIANGVTYNEFYS